MYLQHVQVEPCTARQADVGDSGTVLLTRVDAGRLKQNAHTTEE